MLIIPQQDLLILLDSSYQHSRSFGFRTNLPEDRLQIISFIKSDITIHQQFVVISLKISHCIIQCYEHLVDI